MAATVTFFARDLSGKARKQVVAPSDVRIGDYTGPVLEKLRLPRVDPSGVSRSFHWRNTTQGTLLSPSAPIGRSIAENDEVMLVDEPTAG